MAPPDREADPQGDPPSPPSWLTAARLPNVSRPASTDWHRIHLASHDPVFFGPRPGEAPVHRFDAPDGEFHVLYLGASFESAFVETLLRAPGQRFVDRVTLELRAVSVLRSNRPMRLVPLYGAGLSRIGATNAISTGGYAGCRLWARALWAHRDRPDGLVYRSRHNPALLCAAVFERSDLAFSTLSSMPLLSDPRRVASVLAAHGKGLA